MDGLIEALVRQAEQTGGLTLWLLLFILAVSFSVYILKKHGFITFGKPSGRRRCDKFCEEHAMMKKALEDETKSTDKDLKDIKEMIDKMGSKIDQGMNELYALMREQTKALSDHIGYCRGVQQSKLTK